MTRRRRAAGLAALALTLAACSSGGTATSAPTATPSAAATNSTAPAGVPVARTLDAANAFLATLDAGQRDTVLFDWTDTAQKQRWSNFPPVAFQRAGLVWGDLDQAQQDAWQAIMAASLSTEGYRRVLAEWAADDANAVATGQTDLFGRKYYSISLVGTPSADGPWMWQFGGHHLGINATVAGGRISVTPSFVGDQPASYTDANGATVRPLGDIEDAAVALVGSLDDGRRQTAVLGNTPINLVLGPGEDGKTIAPEGLALSAMTPDQQQAALAVIAKYTGLVDDADAAARRAEVASALDRTYFAWYGPTTAGSPAYFRFTGPTVVIEYAPQGGGGPPGGGAGGGGQGGPPTGGPPTGGGGGPDAAGGAAITGATLDHIHGIYRDPTNEYGAKYAS